MQMRTVLLAVAGALLLVPASSTYPLDGAAKTGIRRLSGYRLVHEGKIKEAFKLPPGALLGSDQVVLRLKGSPLNLGPDTPKDPYLQSGIGADFRWPGIFVRGSDAGHFGRGEAPVRRPAGRRQKNTRQRGQALRGHRPVRSGSGQLAGCRRPPEVAARDHGGRRFVHLHGRKDGAVLPGRRPGGGEPRSCDWAIASACTNGRTTCSRRARTRRDRWCGNR